MRAKPVSDIMEESRIDEEESNEQDLIEKWLKIGKRNLWIRNAYDPPFTKESFCRCETLEDLYSELSKGNWCLAQAFYFENIAFINQIDGGDEWLVIRNALPFESITARYFNFDKLVDFYNRVVKATDEKLKKLEY